MNNSGSTQSFSIEQMPLRSEYDVQSGYYFDETVRVNLKIRPESLQSGASFKKSCSIIPFESRKLTKPLATYSNYDQ